MLKKISLPQRFWLCMFSAFLVWLSFPNCLEKTLCPLSAPLAWVAFIPFFLALEGTTPQQAALLGYLFGFAQMGAIIYWIAVLEEAKYLGPVAWAALVGYLSLYTGLFAWVFRKSTILGLSPVWTAPILWLGFEYFRGSRPWGGFNWGEIGYSQVGYPNLAFWAGIAGEYGLTFLIILMNAYWANLLIKRFNGFRLPAREWAGIFLPIVCLITLMAMGNFMISSTPLRKLGTVALLQPSVDQDEKWTKAFENETYNRYEALIRSCAESKPDLILWPETGAPDFLRAEPVILNRVSRMVAEGGAPELVGCLDVTRDKRNGLDYFNAALEFDEKGQPGKIYHKCHLVPFGEFMPFQKYLTFLGPIVSNLGSFTPGARYMKFSTRAFTYAPAICYETVFPGDMRSAVQTGADVLVNISNDAWYGHTAAAYQHAQMGIMRSSELRRPLLRAANTGISYITDPFGRVLLSGGFFTQQALVGNVLVVKCPMTFYTTWGNWLPEICLWLTAAMVLLGLIRTTPQKTWTDPGQGEVSQPLPSQGDI